MVLLVTDVAIVGVVFVLAMTFLLIRLFRAIERMDEVDPNEPRSFVERLIEAWWGGSRPNEIPPDRER